MPRLSVVKRFAFKTKTLTNGERIRWKFYFEKRKYDRYINLNEYNKYKSGDISYEFPFNIGRSFTFDGYEILKTFR